MLIPANSGALLSLLAQACVKGKWL